QLSRIRFPPRVTTAIACRMRTSACATRTRYCARCVLCWPAFPSASALGSPGSAADRSALFVGFTATMAELDFSCPCIIGYDSSSSPRGPGRHMACGQTRDLPGSDALLVHVMWPSTPAGRQCSHDGIAHIAFDYE